MSDDRFIVTDEVHRWDEDRLAEVQATLDGIQERRRDDDRRRLIDAFQAATRLWRELDRVPRWRRRKAARLELELGRACREADARRALLAGAPVESPGLLELLVELGDGEVLERGVYFWERDR